MRTSSKAFVAATFAALSFAAAAPALADETAPPSDITVTGAATIASQYRFRGVAQSDNKPVVQGTFTIAHKSGFYISTWGSSASAGNSPINIGGTEIDIYGGYTHGIGNTGFTIDGGLYGYIYPGATIGNYWEVYGSVAKTLGPVTAKVGANFAPAQKVFNYNFTSTHRSNLYVYGELGGAIPGTPLSIHSHLAHTGGGFDLPKPFFDYNVGITAKYKNLALDASVVGTNMHRSDFAQSGLCSGAGGGESLTAVDVCANSFYRTTKPVGVVSLTASF
ncbi:TorF family putative porin [Novosphingobium sp.]|uniref:TorF family putative porin n=1 Tax=Novosphingobium sp. TaxID=1874826 RepID=UPI00263A2634|nr:TorF family putative porin [Novosphingobium sp.]